MWMCLVCWLQDNFVGVFHNDYAIGYGIGCIGLLFCTMHPRGSYITTAVYAV